MSFLSHLSRRRFLALAAACGAHIVATGRRPLPAQAAAPRAVPIYLTFDDGVETDGAQGKRGPTLDVLDVLDGRGLQATFFVHGRNTGVAEGSVLARMVRQGHRIGNHLFQQGGTTLAEVSRPAFVARLYLETELRIRQTLAPFPDALARYEEQPHLFRRPGGGYDSAEGNLFLLPASGYWRLFQYDRELAGYRHLLPWLQNVYDYSGWHVAIPPLHEPSADPARLVWRAIDGPGGIRDFIRPDPARPEQTTQEALDGLVLLMHDPDPRTAAVLPVLLDELAAFDISYHVLPRPGDQPNHYTVGVGMSPHPILVFGAERAPIP